MPTPLLKSFAKKAGVSLKKVEIYWDKAKDEAENMGKKDDYGYIVGILKNMLNLDESTESKRRYSPLFTKEETMISADLPNDMPETPYTGDEDEEDEESTNFFKVKKQ